jgi:hypothetical protein
MNEPGLEFVWVGDDAIDPLEQAQTLQILVGAGIKTREEARADLGLGPAGGKGPVVDDTAPKALRKFNPHHDERGQFATEDNAAGPVGSPARKPRPTGVQVASNDTVMSDAGGPAAAAQAAEGSSSPSTIRPAGAEMLSCGDAFASCVRGATFSGAPPLGNCFRALEVCRATGLPTIFGPGIIGKN